MVGTMSAHFFLVRHGKAEKGHGPDAARRLTPRGREQVARLARLLGSKLSVVKIETSPLARARETAEILETVTGAVVEEETALAAGSSSGREILAIGRRAPRGTALVGHNPEFAEAVALAGGEDDLHVPPGTIAAFDQKAKLLWVRAPPD